MAGARVEQQAVLLAHPEPGPGTAPAGWATEPPGTWEAGDLQAHPGSRADLKRPELQRGASVHSVAAPGLQGPRHSPHWLPQWTAGAQPGCEAPRTELGPSPGSFGTGAGRVRWPHLCSGDISGQVDARREGPQTPDRHPLRRRLVIRREETGGATQGERQVVRGLRRCPRSLSPRCLDPAGQRMHSGPAAGGLAGG